MTIGLLAQGAGLGLSLGGLFGESPEDRFNRTLQDQRAQFGFGGVQNPLIPGGVDPLMQENQLLGQQFMNRQAPQVGQSDFRGDQGFLLGQLRGELGPGGGVGAQLA